MLRVAITYLDPVLMENLTLLGVFVTGLLELKVG